MAGVPGIEPGNGGFKARCLTAWLHPIGQVVLVVFAPFCNCFGPAGHTYRRNAPQEAAWARGAALLEAEPAAHRGRALPAVPQALQTWRSLRLGKLLSLPVQQKPVVAIDGRWQAQEAL
jgi:hypothetical protein